VKSVPLKSEAHSSAGGGIVVFFGVPFETPWPNGGDFGKNEIKNSMTTATTPKARSHGVIVLRWRAPVHFELEPVFRKPGRSGSAAIAAKISFKCC